MTDRDWTDPDRAGMGTRDVEKRWRDPAALRRAALYVVSAVGVAAIALAVFLATGASNVVVAAIVPGVCLVAAIGALVIGYRSYRHGGTWPIWQGAAWFLFALMLVSLSLPTATVR
ncbi:hypothetical protein [Rhodococcoides corynebacterioides]|uniref:hypothetical protein n=1 Tax=Rhodococcoides corynebacterioides TaxID=53972 RepID=UPI003AED8C4C